MFEDLTLPQPTGTLNEKVVRLDGFNGMSIYEVLVELLRAAYGNELHLPTSKNKRNNTVSSSILYFLASCLAFFIENTVLSPH